MIKEKLLKIYSSLHVYNGFFPCPNRIINEKLISFYPSCPKRLMSRLFSIAICPYINKSKSRLARILALCLGLTTSMPLRSHTRPSPPLPVLTNSVCCFRRMSPALGAFADDMRGWAESFMANSNRAMVISNSFIRKYNN